VKTKLDPITYEVIRNGLLAGAAEMKVLVMRSSYATLWREAGDLSCAIMNIKGEMICQGPADIPAQLGPLPFSMQGILAKLDAGTFQPGDVLFQNDPLWGNNHLPDCVAAKPIFVDGEIIAYSVVRGHWTDMGGSGPGSYSSVTTEHLQEGLTIPPLRLYKAGVMDMEIADLILANVRNRQERLGDMRAQYAGCVIGERKVLDLVKRYGKDAVLAAFGQILEHTETLMRQEIEKIPDGTYHFTSGGDGDGVDDRRVTFQIALQAFYRRVLIHHRLVIVDEIVGGALGAFQVVLVVTLLTIVINSYYVTITPPVEARDIRWVGDLWTLLEDSAIVGALQDGFIPGIEGLLRPLLPADVGAAPA